MENKFKKITSLWIITVLILFVVAIILGLLMRFNQGGNIKLDPVTFYTDMTIHGLTMIGIWFVAGMAAVNYIMERYVRTSYKANLIAYIMTVVGVLMLWGAGFIGKFHAGWTFLYPLPFKIMWEQWATPLFLYALLVLGVGWTIWTVSLMISLLKKYTLSQVFAWQHFKRDAKPEVETPPFVLISMISLVGVLSCLITAAALDFLLLTEYYSNGGFINDALLMKNLTYFFGHTLANEMLYLGLAVIYELFSEVSGRPKWKTSWYVAYAWNLTLFFVLFAFLHHMYMDFVQPETLQIIGQLASYLASIPSTGVTIFSILVAVYGTKINWNLANLMFFIGTAGWVSGGIGAVIDATISNNFLLHNTLWVPAHFHTYNALGNVLFSLGFFYWFSFQLKDGIIKDKHSMLKILLIVIGGIGFLAAFYFAGADSVARRYANYPEEMASGKFWATFGGTFATIYLLGIILFIGGILKRCFGFVFSRV
ncbi:MAG: cbb3-type cytochrome c oxidase subunit I [Saprospiraceae bacterium]|nr:MAG: cytochrome c oxidase subunit I [Bacteroidetes bacterium OLB9]MCO6464705.1 cbb3-type cytochrome c oxidase subunit I [Saprospiraceae bacterium]